jgi:autotransporter translocation and assembly factor TamB
VRAVVAEGGEVDPVTVRVTVGGTLSRPQVEMNVVLGFATNRFGQRIGQELNLDLVEVDVGRANISRIRVGKYLGPRLFLSYAKDISTVAWDMAIEFEVLPGLTVEGLHVQEVDEETNNQRTRESLGLFWKKEW